MPSRVYPFVNGQYYHIYNRGSEKKPIFQNNRDKKRFLKTFLYYQIEGPKPRFSLFNPTKPLNKLDQNNKIVEIISFCLMPNHFHFLLKQVKEGGITEFISKLSNSYTKYFNIKNNRIGPLLQGEFKSVPVETDEQLLHLSRYIHLNPLVSGFVENLDLYEWSSYREYITEKTDVCDKEIILRFFQSLKSYRQFVQDQADYGMQLEIIKHQLHDEH
jgi:putative transposase